MIYLSSLICVTETYYQFFLPTITYLKLSEMYKQKLPEMEKKYCRK